MLQTCLFLSTSSPGPCNKVVVGYHSVLDNGNPQSGRMLKKDVGVARTIPVLAQRAASEALVGRAQLGSSQPPLSKGSRQTLIAALLGQGAPRRARVGWVRSLGFLSIL
jgi:hypothetical protein